MTTQAPTESVTRTMLIAVSVALFCSAMVSGAVYLLRPLQAAYASLERNETILRAAGQLPSDTSDRAIINAYLELDARVVDLTSGISTSTLNGHAYDHWAPTGVDTDPTIMEMDSVGLSTLPRYVPIYIVSGPTGIERLVLPLHGRGMWSMLLGYVALEPDLQTIATLAFYKHGETPGIGDRILDDTWLQSWQGKRLYDSSGAVQIRMDANKNTPAQYRVDAITGATVTSQAVARMVAFWAAAYAPLLRQLSNEMAKQPANAS
jgi:Na+-transporting NADH:ubiquinone oxidoreductase subunit C